MRDLLIILGEILLIFVACGVAAFAVLFAMAVYGERVALRVEREVPSRELASMMIGSSELAQLRRPGEHPLDRLARHCAVKIVDPSEPGVLPTSGATRTGDAPSEVHSHAERGGRR